MSVSELEVRIAKLQKKILDDLDKDVPEEVEKLAATDISALKSEPGYMASNWPSYEESPQDVKTAAQDITNVKSYVEEVNEVMNDLRGHVEADIAATKQRLQEGVSYLTPEAERRGQTREADRDDR